MRSLMLGYWILVALLLPGLMGCEPKGTEVDPDTRHATPVDSPLSSQLPKWFPHAVDVRVHPASRYVMERDALRLEARIELLDEFNEPIKDVGNLVVEMRLLNANGQIVLDAQGRQRGFRWAFDLTSKQVQQDLWDPIARAYMLPLKIDPVDADLPDYRTVLRATFEPAWPGKPILPKGENARQPVEIRTDW